MTVVGIVGSKGLVGNTLKKCLIGCKEAEIKEFSRQDKPEKVDIVVLCTDNADSINLVQEFDKKAKYIIDMSSEFRLKPGVPLVIPEINDNAVTRKSHLIASPNCTTTALVMALAALKKDYRLKEIFFCSYQAISGGGKKLVEEAANPNSIYQNNCVPKIGSILDNGFTSEEVKAIYETRKILNLPKVAVYPHTVRVSVPNCHCLGVTIKTTKNIDLAQVKNLFSSFPGLRYSEDVLTPKDCDGKNDTFVCRVRKDTENEKVLHFFLVMDNILKGAALNGAQIIERIIQRGLV